MENVNGCSQRLAASMTKGASKQTYYTIRFLVDNHLIPNAYQAYAYFRWVDDVLDQPGIDESDSTKFINRQTSLVNACFQGNWPDRLTPEEQMLVDLTRDHPQDGSGLQAYIDDMMRVMSFDAHRRGLLISQHELSEYARILATAVTEALHYFIGNNCPSPHCEARYLAATGAHITHMLRDTYEDTASGYFNIPREYLEKHKITQYEINSDAYRVWVRSRVRLAREYFSAGKEYLSQVENFRCRIAGYTYMARFEWILDVIERENYILRPDYSERKKPSAVLSMALSVLSMTYNQRKNRGISQSIPAS
jgi:phytoene/squalene synthetase